VFPLNLILPNAPTLGHGSVPSLPGPKILCLQLKIPFVINLNGPTLRWHFQQPRYVQGPTTLTQTSNESIETTPTKIDQPQQNAARWSSPQWIAPLWHLLHFALLSFLSQLGLLSSSPYFVSDNKQQQHLSMLVSNTMANSFSRLLPDPQFLMAAQPWEQPTDLAHAKNLLG